MKILILIVIFVALFAVINKGRRRSGTLTEPANKAIGAMATCARYFIYGVLAFLGFTLATYIAETYFGGVTPAWLHRRSHGRCAEHFTGAPNTTIASAEGC